jgi:hypothetical protein
VINVLDENWCRGEISLLFCSVGGYCPWRASIGISNGYVGLFLYTLVMLFHSTLCMLFFFVWNFYVHYPICGCFLEAHCSQQVRWLGSRCCCCKQTTGWSRIQILAVERHLSLLWTVHMSSGAHASAYGMGYRDSFPGVEWLGCEGYHSSPSSAEVKNEWNYTSTAPVSLHGM